MEERLQKIIAERCRMSRRAAEIFISDGRVSVNGMTAHLGDKADPERDEICIDGEPVSASVEEKVYIMLNKPVGYVTTMSDEKGRKTVADLTGDVGVRVYPVGRLDINSDGLLIMTNDGELANRLMHPSFEKNKTYRVSVNGDVKDGVKHLLEPMELDGVRLRTPEVEIKTYNEAGGVMYITIHEGRNRQVRRMCEFAGLKVTKLTRIAEGGIKLGNLAKGQWRYLTKSEIELLQRNK